MDDAVLVEDVDGRGDLFAVEPDDVLLQPQPGHLLQRPLVAVLHEDVHLLLGGGGRRVSATTKTASGVAHVADMSAPTHPMELHSEVPHQVGVLDAFKYLEFVCRLLDGFVVVGLEADLVEQEREQTLRVCSVFHSFIGTNLFHGHEFASVDVDAGVHLPVLTLTCDTHTRRHHCREQLTHK